MISLTQGKLCIPKLSVMFDEETLKELLLMPKRKQKCLLLLISSLCTGSIGYYTHERNRLETSPQKIKHSTCRFCYLRCAMP